MTREEQIAELTEWEVEHMDIDELASYVKQQLEEYYASEDGLDDFENNYAEMKEIKAGE